jgi:hypothetical protein
MSVATKVAVENEKVCLKSVPLEFPFLTVTDNEGKTHRYAKREVVKALIHHVELEVRVGGGKSSVQAKPTTEFAHKGPGLPTKIVVHTDAWQTAFGKTAFIWYVDNYYALVTNK